MIQTNLFTKQKLIRRLRKLMVTKREICRVDKLGVGINIYTLLYI